MYKLADIVATLLGDRRFHGNYFVPHSLGGGGVVLISAPEYEVDVTTRNGVMAHFT